MKVLTLIRGLPGSGKSTLAKAIANSAEGYAARFEADMYFMEGGEYKFDARKLGAAHAWCQENVAVAMSNGTPTIIVSNTFTRKSEMTPYVTMAINHGYKINVIVCMGSFGSVHNVPEETMQKMKERFEYV